MLVIPAEKSPTAKKYFANFPNRGSNPNAKSLAPEMLAFSIPEAEIIILKEIIPPRPMDMYKSLSAYSSSFDLDHLFFANSEWRKRLYGTIVVPIKPMIVNKLPFGVSKENKPENMPLIEGFVNKTVAKKDILIILSLIHISEPTRPY